VLAHLRAADDGRTYGPGGLVAEGDLVRVRVRVRV